MNIVKCWCQKVFGKNCKFSSDSLLLNDMYIWVSSAYRWYEKGVECKRCATGVVYIVKSSGPSTEPWGTPVTKGSKESTMHP